VTNVLGTFLCSKVKFQKKNAKILIKIVKIMKLQNWGKKKKKNPSYTTLKVDQNSKTQNPK
jgi:hypothetical protein